MDRRSFVTFAPAAAAAAVSATLTIREDGKPPIDALDVSVLRLQPGDVLVLSAPGLIREDDASRISTYLEQCLSPFDVKAIVMSDGLKVDGVLRHA